MALSKDKGAWLLFEGSAQKDIPPNSIGEDSPMLSDNQEAI
jgi:hypothetical protein